MAAPILGIDPGLDGAAVLLVAGAPTFFDTPTVTIGRGRSTKRAYAEQQMAQIVRQATSMNPGLKVVIESVHSMPGQGVRSVFTFGEGFGLWRGILAACEVPFELVSPQRWKAGLLDGTGKDKDASRLRAMQLYPAATEWLKRKKDNGRADALLIAEWGRRSLA